MQNPSFTQGNSQTQILDGVLVLDQLLTIAEAKQKFAKSEAEANAIEQKIRYALRAGKLKSEKGNGRTVAVKIKQADIENYLSEAEANSSYAQDSISQSELASSLREANESLKSQLEFLQKQLEKKDEHIEKLLEGEEKSKSLLENQQMLTSQLQKQLQIQTEEKTAAKNQPKKGLFGWFNNSD